LEIDGCNFRNSGENLGGIGGVFFCGEKAGNFLKNCLNGGKICNKKDF
jgi:hypothetical protein